MRVSDLILVNEDGAVVQGDQPINAAAFAIHSAIHKRRPDVHAACATPLFSPHSPSLEANLHV
jgi:ribulose-5-phosphate 4-epimerase/fuculose-1-phosphate aldolase